LASPDTHTRELWLAGALGLGPGESPFPWQVDLLERFQRNEPVSSLDIPTGLGKTAVMAIWLVARACGANVPRLLVYVVDRRAVVDQATTVAERLRAWVGGETNVRAALGMDGELPVSTLRGQHVDNKAWLDDPSLPAIVVGTVDMVGSRLLFSGYGVSTRMRPYHAGLLGTDTLVVLDEAHLVPAFEDLLRQIERGADSFGPNEPSLRTLVPPFRLLSLSATGRLTDATTLTVSDHDRSNPIVRKRLTAKKVLSIVDMAKATAAADDGKNADDPDEATKKNKAPTLAEVLAMQAWQTAGQSEPPVRCLVYCDRRTDAIAVADALRELAKSSTTLASTIELFVGARRVRERTNVARWLVEHGFVEEKGGTRAMPEGPTFLVATSAGEVGVDMDADHMVCDLVAWERMVQRLGRVNRRGDGEAKVVVVVAAGSPDEDSLRQASQGEGDKLPKEQKRTLDLFDKRRKATEAHARLKLTNLPASERKALKKQISAYKDGDAKKLAAYEAEVAKHRALRKLLDVVAMDGGCLSPATLLKLRACKDLADALRDATTVAPLRPELTRALIDAWSMTSLDEHPGRPEVDPWLRGFRPDEPSQTTVVWRRHLPVRADGLFDTKAAKRFFEAAPVHTSEQLETETHIVLDWLIERAQKLFAVRDDNAALKADDVVMIALGPRGEPKGQRTLRELAVIKGEGKSESKRAREELEKLLVGLTLVIDARLGGLDAGLLNAQTSAIAETSDDGSTRWLYRPDASDVPVTGFRIRVLGAGEDDAAAWRTAPGAGWVRRHLFVTSVMNGEPATALVVDGWAADAATEEERGEADRPQQLDEHQSWAADCANTIGRRLGIEQARVDLLALAARLHDEGKRAARWQRAFKAPIDGRPYAKTKGPIDFDFLDGYRHELGSLPYVEAHADFQKLSSEDQDFVLHLIAAHHGFARPVIGTTGCDDALPPIIDARARAVALRFARLSRRWGPWGLAWWEALLRAADQTASRRNQQAAAAPKEQLR
jgi:CRISPR-associated endonuclease/helicase Cas3